MNVTKIRKNSDYNIMLTSRFELVIYNSYEERYEYPILVSNELVLDVPPNHTNIENFLNKNSQFLHGLDVLDFFKFAKIDLTPFIWMMMADGDIDIYWNAKELYIKYAKDYIVLNSKNIDMKIVDRLYKTQDKDYINSMYTECMEDMFEYIRRKIANSIVHNDFYKSNLENFKDLESHIEKEYQKKDYNFAKILFFYEKMIRLREKFAKDNMFHLVSEEEINELYMMLQKIREIVNSQYSQEYSVERM